MTNESRSRWSFHMNLSVQRFLDSGSSPYVCFWADSFSVHEILCLMLCQTVLMKWTTFCLTGYNVGLEKHLRRKPVYKVHTDLLWQQASGIPSITSGRLYKTLLELVLVCGVIQTIRKCACVRWKWVCVLGWVCTVKSTDWLFVCFPVCTLSKKEL